MSIASKLAFQVDKSAQVRGYDIFQDGGVRIGEVTASSVEATVRGTDVYAVDLVLEDDLLGVFCGCPAFAKSGPCKHVWATILTADSKHLLASARGTAKLTITSLDELDKASHEELKDDDEDDDEDEDDDPFFIDPPARRPTATAPPPEATKPKSPPTPLWREQLQLVLQDSRAQAADELGTPWPPGMELAYVICLTDSRRTGALVMTLQSRNRKQNGEWTVFKDFRIAPSQTTRLPDPADSELVSLVLGGQSPYTFTSAYGMGANATLALPIHVAWQVLPRMAAHGRLWIANDVYSKDHKAATWDEGEAWRFWLGIRRNERDLWEITSELRRGDERMGIHEPQLFLPSGLLLSGNRLSRFGDPAAQAWIRSFRSDKVITFMDRDRDEVFRLLLDAPAVPNLDVDPELAFEQRQGQPRFGLRLEEAKTGYQKDRLDAMLLADYGSGFGEVRPGGSRGFWIAEERAYLLRNREAEDAAVQKLQLLGVRWQGREASSGTISAKAMPKLVRELVAAAWHVEAHGQAFRRAGFTGLSVTTGIDWFELHGEVDFDGQSAGLPELLAAAKRGDGMVRLGDGSFGMLPEDWVQRFAPLAALGQPEENHVRFQANQAALLDALLAAQPQVDVDAAFQKVRERIRSFQGVKPAAQPKGFQGKLRDYQLEGLGWIGFLRDYGFGGILADDMGVGKTAQVLAALEERRPGKHGPSLVVAPRSLIFNWMQEAARFTPSLKLLDHTGLQRDVSHIDDYQLVLTTYGTLQRDIAALSRQRFDYVILDEAQAIKNATTVSAKAVRLLQANHRLALSGTPIENHLGELWSLFEFLNPGMLGEAKVLKMSGGLARNPSAETRQLLATALRPYILRRTKQQVARELPEKTEQTIFVELEGEQRRKYEELRDHYRARLLGKVAPDVKGQGNGMKDWNKMKIQVLEALLRLRQAACHPGLLEPKQASETGAKFSTLLDQLQELREEGHKALVFSQFTSLLGLLRQRLDQEGYHYEYLDGQTRDRQACVERFQTDPDCQLFLISLKAGGLGLNLTAAGYVFLLDPWWNPAVEAQAIDRAHRIGQTQNVFAYRLIAKDTVEEKVLELQKTKRELADAILSEDNRLLRDLKREDLELLLS